VLEHSLRAFLGDPECVAISVALARDDVYWPELVTRIGNSRLQAVEGGTERAHSVRRALQGLEFALAPNDWVLVHDAARPCVTRAEIDALKAAVVDHPVGGLLAVPLADTLKRARSNHSVPSVEATAAREGLWRALTPQAFRFAPLCAALDAALATGKIPTDESQAIEWQGGQPLLVAGSSENIKVTLPSDLSLAEALLARRAAS
jgi:2-C-methyl-D-erythritol 4-phosphate cytidylyltransferase